ncbi:MAG: hypothetical protein D6715_13980 [Calditrichaeota bacterium]|nr:MAG: hypothetical protein D6715_13980 [Calditrichota bacterium]
MFTRLAKHRSFTYEPHYYKPEKDEQERRRQRIKFRRPRHRPRRASTVGLFLLLAFIVYLLHLLSQLGK